MRRATSPALSENEVDISRSLFQDGAAESDTESAGEITRRPVDERRTVLRNGDNDEDEDDEAFIAASQAAVNRKRDPKTSKKPGAFQTMGLSTNVLKAITRKGFTVPTPIQRKTIPLILDGQDVVGMARTGSGKTAAFVIPMIEKLKAHSAKVGARAMILSPSRELALQTMKVVKELGKGTDLRTTLLVGGDSLEDQFSGMAANPDIIVATPGRFEHLKVEMSLELSSVKFVVFDEADRLFEMGFAAQLMEIMHSLPSSRQTLLFSATLPQSLVEFARAGLSDPKLVRLDAESKISPGLQSAFFLGTRAEKEGMLLHLLQDVVKMPTGETEAAIKIKTHTASEIRKRKRDEGGRGSKEAPSLHSTILFTATKHHVEYLVALLKHFGYATSYVYGALDQTARKMQVHDFRTGMTNILVVTDVAARGLDIPVLANVINYDFPSQPKIFVHRVGRTARAGKPGWSYSFVTGQDMPYLLDLQLFLGRKLVLGHAEKEVDMFQNCIVVGAMVRERLERSCEEVSKLLDDNGDVVAVREVAAKGEKQYLRTRNAASAESVKRAKKLAGDESLKGASMLFQNDGDDDEEQRRLDMLARVSGFRPLETVFEIGKRGTANNETADLVRKRRQQIELRRQKNASGITDGTPQSDAAMGAKRGVKSTEDDATDNDSDDDLVLTLPNGKDAGEDSDSEFDLTITAPSDELGASKASKARRLGDDDGNWQDSEHFMSYTPTSLNLAEDRGYSVSHNDSANAKSNFHFLEAARGATMDLANDESAAFKEASKPGLRWDKKHKKYVSRANDEDGSKGNTKYIRGESGQKIAATFRSGRFAAWKKANKLDHLPRVGEVERTNTRFTNVAPGGGPGGARRFRHKQELAPKEADKYRDDFYKKRKQVAEAKEKRVGRFADGPGKGKSEIRGVDDVRKVRKMEQKRKDKSARPTQRRK